MRAVLITLCAAAILGLIGTFAVESSYDSRAQKVQLVRIDRAQHSLFGPVTVEQGEPTSMIVADPTVFLKNKTAIGLPMIDADYLAKHQGAAMQLGPLETVVGMARIGCALSAVVAGGGLILLGRLNSIAISPEA